MMSGVETGTVRKTILVFLCWNKRYYGYDRRVVLIYSLLYDTDTDFSSLRLAFATVVPVLLDPIIIFHSQ
jgi:hypothetical protein